MLRSLAVGKKSFQLYKIGFSFSFLDLQLTNVLFFSQLLFSTLEAFLYILGKGGENYFWTHSSLPKRLEPKQLV